MVELTWSTACLDWKRRIRDRRSLIPFSPLFPVSAEAKMAVFTSLKIVDLPGQPTFGEASDEWLLDFAAAVFGAFDPETNRQLITEYFLLISKKNTKSTLAAGIMLTELACGFRSYDENLILAPTKEVAANSFAPAMGMIDADEELADLLKYQEHLKLITHREMKSTLKVVAADSGTVAGKKASRVLVDELWLFGEMSNADSMLKEATGGQVSRPEGYTIYLTTQSDKPPAGVFKQKLGYFRDVRDGKIVDPRKLPVLYEFPDEMVAEGEHLSPANFYLTNPNIGRSVTQTWLEEKASEADHDADGPRAVFYAKHLNVEIGIGLRHDAWVGALYWQAAQAAPEVWDGSLDQFLEIVEVVVAGGDGGGLDDLFGLALLGRHKVTKQWLLWCKAWAQQDVFERRKDIVSNLDDFATEGSLVKCVTPTQDLVEVVDLLERIKDLGLFPEQAAIGLDPQNITSLVDELTGRGFTVEQLPAISQGYRLSGAVWGTERKLKDGTMIHAGQRLMAWCAGNAKAEQRGNAVLITKQVAGKAKIDPLIAAFNAVVLMSRNPEAAGAGPQFMFI
ncbi:terminase large subunit [Sphingomonas echinoides]|uniref:terminase large subunit n=1 Tax=Sphingomonas echinoides TaxID=59803 RepID=UPI002413107C|nr:terminase large subunit [Sphingomonas echinoides]